MLTDECKTRFEGIDMRYANLFFLLIATSFFTLPSYAQDWKWAGFEIIGNHSISKNEILKHIPLKVGEDYKENSLTWKQWCGDLKNRFGFHFTQCSTVRYIDFKAYFVIEVVEIGYEYRNQFRSEPTEDIPFASTEILNLYARLYKRLSTLFEQGIGVQESVDKGYLDYSDKEMHEIVQQLIQLVPQYRENLLEVLAKDIDINKREKAANLLNWTVADIDNTVVKANALLDDPSGLVRNNVSRFTLHFIDKVNSQDARKGLIDRLLLQLDRPSFGDRNKAIFNLVALASRFPEDRPYLKEKGFSLIDSIATNSILENVRDPAAQLLKLLNSEEI